VSSLQLVNFSPHDPSNDFLCNRINRAARARAHTRRLKECAGPYLKFMVETIAIFDAMRAEGQRIQSGWGNARWV
jgi:hypothetical protein